MLNLTSGSKRTILLILFGDIDDKVNSEFEDKKKGRKEDRRKEKRVTSYWVTMLQKTLV